MSDMTVFSICMTLLMVVLQVQPSVLDTFRHKVSSECVVIDYEFSTSISGIRTVGDGTVEVQRDSYHMMGNGVEIYCDGTSTWLIDEAAGEVVIESADSEESGLLANPVMLLMNLDEYGISYSVDGDNILLTLQDGTKLDIRIIKMTSIQTKKPEAFRPPTEFSKDWIVTDLR